MPLGGYLCLAFLVFLPAWMHPTTTTVGYSGDAQQTMWFLSWTPWAIGHGVNPLLTTHLNHPDGINLMWDSWAPLLGVLLWPVTATGGPVLSYNVLLTVEIALAAWCAFLAIRRYTPDVAAVAGGLLYGFGPFLMNQAHGHAKVTFALLPPLLFIVLDDICVRRRHTARRAGILLGLALAAQFYVLQEGVVLAVLAGAVGVAVLALLFPARVAERWWHTTRAVMWSVVVFVPMVALPLGVQLWGPGRVHGTVPGSDTYVTDPVALVVPTTLQWFSWGALSDRVGTFAGNAVEGGAYLGIPLLAVVLLTMVVWWRRPVARWAGLTAAVLTVLSLGPHLHVGGSFTGVPLPYILVQAVSHIGSALPVRLFVHVEFLVALLVAVFAGEVLLVARRRPLPVVRVASGGAMLALAFVMLVPETPFATAAMQVPGYFAGGAVRSLPEGTVALVAPFVQDGVLDDPMLWQASAEMHFRMPEGYFVRPDEQAGDRADGPKPSTTSRTMTSIALSGRAPQVTDALRKAVRDDLRRWRVSVVIVGPMPHREVMSRFFTELLGTRAESHDGVQTWRL